MFIGVLDDSSQSSGLGIQAVSLGQGLKIFLQEACSPVHAPLFRHRGLLH